MSGEAARTLCIGDAIVDLVGERPGATLAAVDRFSAHFGGAVANVAIVAARAGAPVSLAGGAGDDAWGRRLRGELEAAGVDVTRFVLVPGVETPLAFVTVSADGEPTYHLRGEQRELVTAAIGEGLGDAVTDAGALFISTNTLVGRAERAMTMRARELALAAGKPLVFDANLRLHRWATRADAVASANACVNGALLVRANRAEAQLMTGEDVPDRAAAALVKSGARLVVLTLGSDGAILSGALRATVPGVPCRPVNTAGAGDVLTGTLLARLALSGFDPASVAASLPEAIEAAARACERWGAVD